MLQIRKIVHATDFSEASRPALDEALLWAELNDASLTLLHVLTLKTGDPFHPEHHFPEPDELLERLRALADSEMATILAPHRERPLEIHQVIRHGMDAEKEILDFVEELGADMLVVGTHGRRGASHLLMGSTAAELLRHARCPVLVVPARGAELPLGLRRILAPTDFSDASRRALAHAFALAASAHATVDLLHVIPPLEAALPMNLGGMAPLTMVAELEPAARQELTLMAATAPTGVTVESAIWQGPVVSSILNRATESSATLIVLATSGRTGFDRLLLGSVAESVARLAPCPVWIVPTLGRSLLPNA